MKKKIVKKPWGFETIWYGGDKVQFKTLHIKKGEMTSLQYHKHKDEIIYPLDKHTFLNDGDKEIKLKPFISIHINSGKIHQYRAIGGDAVIAEMNCGDDSDIIRIADIYDRNIKVRKNKSAKTK